MHFLLGWTFKGHHIRHTHTRTQFKKLFKRFWSSCWIISPSTDRPKWIFILCGCQFINFFQATKQIAQPIEQKQIAYVHTFAYFSSLLWSHFKFITFAKVITLVKLNLIARFLYCEYSFNVLAKYLCIPHVVGDGKHIFIAVVVIFFYFFYWK